VPRFAERGFEIGRWTLQLCFMPHIWLKNPNVNAMRCDKIIFCGTNDHQETLIALNFKGAQFALSLKQKNVNWLLKYNKSTRPSDTTLLKEALKFIAVELNGEIIFDNTQNSKTYTLDGLLDASDFDPSIFVDKKVFAEIGFGSGTHLQNIAANNPKNAYIGVEIYKPAINKFLNRCALEGVKNVYAIDEDARIFFEILPREFLDGIYVHFPVPWPEAAYRRVWSKEFVNCAFACLKEGGFIHLRTDDKEYFEFAVALSKELGLEYNFAINDELDVVSKYEARWQRQNKDIFDFILYKPNGINCAKVSYNFSFNETPSLVGAISQDELFVSVKSPYVAANGDKMLKVALGAVNRPKVYLIKIDDSGATYWPKAPLGSSANAMAHNILIKGQNWKR